jgi:EpsG-like putative glucosyltransferase
LRDAMTVTEPGYAVSNWTASQLGLGVWAVNLACATIFATGLISLCRWQPNPPLALLVAVPYLVIVVAMGYTRQSAALGLIMFATTQLHRGSLLKMAGFLVLAVLFHRAAIIVLPLFALAASKQRFLSIVLVGVLGWVIYIYFVSSSIDRFVRVYVDTRYSSSGALVRVLMNIGPAMLFLALRKRFGFHPVQERLWTLFSIASLVALVALFYSPSSTAVDRFALFLIPLQVVVFSRLPSALGTPNRQALYVVTSVIAYSFLVEIVWLNFGQFSSYWIPYRNYIFEALV